MNISKYKGKTMTGKVVSDKTDKTVIVEIISISRHPVYKKTMKRKTRFAVHVDSVKPKIGDMVKIKEIPPISKSKHFVVMEIL